MLLRCYPKVTDWIYHFFNQNPAADYRFLPIYSYGFFVALAFFAAASLAVIEMRRREKLGLLTGKEVQITIGEAPNIFELLLYLFLGFTVFYKIAGIFTFHEVLRSHQLAFGDYLLPGGNGFISKILSIYKYGNWPVGILGAVTLGAYYYYSKNKEKLNPPVTKTQMVYPSDSIGDLLVIAMVLGVLGSNLFNFLENPSSYSDFWKDPVGSLFSGLSIYGGLICAGIGFFIYAYIKKFSLAHFFDAVCPGVALANGIGRLGCQSAGDGDWGIVNLHPKPSWFPQFLWSSHYRNNIIDMDPMSIIPNCYEEHCHFLINPVYPTPIYEFLMCSGIFLILWLLRKRLSYKPFMVFSLFMLLVGIERFAIEQWRDISGRDLYHIFGLALRQSEIISIVLIIVGSAITGYLAFHYREKAKGLNGKGEMGPEQGEMLKD